MKKHTHYKVIATAVLYLIMQINFHVFANTENRTVSVKTDDSMQGHIIAPEYSKQINEEFVLYEEQEGKGRDKDKSKGKGRIKTDKVKHKRFIPPGLLKQNKGGSDFDIDEKVKGKRQNRGRGNGRIDKQSSVDWSGEWLVEVKPITGDEDLLIRFDVSYDEAEKFEDAYPSVLPLNETYITSAYGKRKKTKGRGNDFHNGVDLKANYQDIWATGSGIVTFAGYMKSFGNIVVIDHGYGIETKYAHNSMTLVTEGQTVKRFDVIAISGNSGNSTGPHLHYEIVFDGVSQDPIEIIFNRNTD